MGISVSSKLQTNFVKLKKTTTNSTTTLNYITTVHLNVSKELININANKDIKINNKILENEGEEFIKLLGLRNWAEKSGEKFIIPDLKLSDNDTINECISILSSMNDNQVVEILMDEQYKYEFAKTFTQEGFYKGLVISSFEFFLEGINDDRAYNLLKNNNVVLEDESEIKSILNDRPDVLVHEFIDYLKIYGFF